MGESTAVSRLNENKSVLPWPTTENTLESRPYTVYQSTKMAQTLTAVRGMNDLLPQDSPKWQLIEHTLRSLSASFGYDEIRFPLVEKTELFCRSIGEGTDIVEKEMYTFTDLNGESLTLRPEGTAPCCRAVIEHGLAYNQVQKVWYQGPVFRHERPQKGRYRQFHQFGVEAFGMAGAMVDAELIVMTAALWRQLGIQSALSLEINTLGDKDARSAYRNVLIEYFSAHEDKLDEDSKRRLHKNPLRILDSKNKDMQTLIESAPKLIEHISEECKAHFDSVCAHLTAHGINYTVNPRLVRGLDYYNRTVFEWVTDKLGAQGTVCAGGRYDGLIEELGGRATPAVGFALGIERLLLVVDAVNPRYFDAAIPLDCYVICEDSDSESVAALAESHLRAQSFAVKTDCSGASFKAQFKRAVASGARTALVISQDTRTEQKYSLKYLTEKKDAFIGSLDECIDQIKQA